MHADTLRALCVAALTWRNISLHTCQKIECLDISCHPLCCSGAGKCACRRMMRWRSSMRRALWEALWEEHLGRQSMGLETTEGMVSRPLTLAV